MSMLDQRDICSQCAYTYSKYYLHNKLTLHLLSDCNHIDHHSEISQSNYTATFTTLKSTLNTNTIVQNGKNSKKVNQNNIKNEKSV